MTGLRVLVCGGRDWCDIRAMLFTMDDLDEKRGPFTHLIHGGADGADDEANCWALHRDIPITVFNADWDRYGRKAGPIRNQRMIDEGKPDLVVAFPGGRGTADMVKRAKAYGSIGHLPSSRIGPGDHFVHAGQQAICTERPRKGDRIIVTEKLDGACMSVANIDGEIVGLSRAGYRAADALYEHLQIFDAYVAQNLATFAALLAPGERVVGEWLAMAHGTIYEHQHPAFAPFVAFDIFRDGKRVLFDEFSTRVDRAGIPRAHVLHDYPTALCVKGALEKLVGSPWNGFHFKGYHGAVEDVEGAVWRVEREGRVDFLAKFVRHDKIDGKYLPNLSGRPPVWHWHPTAAISKATGEVQ